MPEQTEIFVISIRRRADTRLLCVERLSDLWWRKCTGDAFIETRNYECVLSYGDNEGTADAASYIVCSRPVEPLCARCRLWQEHSLFRWWVRNDPPHPTWDALSRDRYIVLHRFLINRCNTTIFQSINWPCFEVSILYYRTDYLSRLNKIIFWPLFYYNMSKNCAHLVNLYEMLSN